MPRMRVDLSFLLNQAAYAFSAQLGAALADLGITVRDFCVLLKAAEEERTQNAVAELARPGRRDPARDVPGPAAVSHGDGG